VARKFGAVRFATVERPFRHSKVVRAPTSNFRAFVTIGADYACCSACG